MASRVKGAWAASDCFAALKPLALCNTKKMVLEVDVREDKGEHGVEFEADRFALIVMVKKLRANDEDGDERQCEGCENHQGNCSDEKPGLMVGIIRKVVKE